MAKLLRISFVCLLVWACFSSDLLYAQADEKSDEQPSARLRSVEKKLRRYLKKRVLVFRKGEISRHQIKLDSQGTTESGSKLNPRPNAILFTSLTLDPEQLVILGEAARIRPTAAQKVLSRHPRQFRLVTCTLSLDVSPDEMTFTHAIRRLCQLFLTREEFQSDPNPDGQ